MVTPVYNPSTREVEAGGSGVYTKFRTTLDYMRPCLKKPNELKLKQKPKRQKLKYIFKKMEWHFYV